MTLIKIKDRNNIENLFKRFCEENNIIIMRAKKRDYYIMPTDKEKAVMMLEQIIEVFNSEELVRGMREEMIHTILFENNCIKL